MSERMQGKSIGLVSSALLASVAGMSASSALVGGSLVASLAMMTESVSADPTPGTALYFGAAWDNATPFGTVVDAWLGYTPFGSTQTFNSYFGGPSHVDLTTGLSNRPGWEYEAVVDFTLSGMDPNAYAGYNKITFYLGYIKPAGTNNPVSAFEVKNALGVVVAHTPAFGGTNGTFIGLQVNMADILLDAATPDIMTVQWRQDPIPAPGALALLGIAGVVGGRRRRR